MSQLLQKVVFDFIFESFGILSDESGELAFGFCEDRMTLTLLNGTFQSQHITLEKCSTEMCVK